MDKNYYRAYYDLERSNWWFLVRSKIIKQSIKRVVGSRNDLKILNLGVATGATSTMLRNFGDVVSSEYDPDTCKFLKEELNMEVVHASITDLPFPDNAFDLVCAFDVIEHVEDDKKACEEMVRVCKSEGHLAITVPTFMSLWSDHDVINHHFRRYTKSQINKLVKSQKLKIKYYSYFNSILFLPIYLFRKLSNLKLREKKESSDFEMANSKFHNIIFKRIFSIELYLLRWIRFPVGVSLINISQKINSDVRA